MHAPQLRVSITIVLRPGMQVSVGAEPHSCNGQVRDLTVNLVFCSSRIRPLEKEKKLCWSACQYE